MSRSLAAICCRGSAQSGGLNKTLSILRPANSSVVIELQLNDQVFPKRDGNGRFFYVMCVNDRNGRERREARFVVVSWLKPHLYAPNREVACIRYRHSDPPVTLGKRRSSRCSRNVSSDLSCLLTNLVFMPLAIDPSDVGSAPTALNKKSSNNGSERKKAYECSRPSRPVADW